MTVATTPNLERNNIRDDMKQDTALAVQTVPKNACQCLPTQYLLKPFAATVNAANKRTDGINPRANASVGN